MHIQVCTHVRGCQGKLNACKAAYDLWTYAMRKLPKFHAVYSRALAAIGHAVRCEEVHDQCMPAGGGVAVALHALGALLVQLRSRAAHASNALAHSIATGFTTHRITVARSRHANVRKARFLCTQVHCMNL